VLPAEQRVRRPEDFSAAVRDGRRVAAPGLVLHVRSTSDGATARVGFVVGKAVGPAVVRNRVRRRLRHLLAPRLTEFAAGTTIVVRVLPTAATVSRRVLGSTANQLIDRAAAMA
jgi:ribonuclease P protein component